MTYQSVPSAPLFSERSLSLESTWIEIDQKILFENFKAIQALASPAKCCLPIKANAYGHGLIQVAKLAKRAGVDYLAVSNLYEGMLLRKADIQGPILVLGAFQESQIEMLIEYDLEFSVSSLYKAQSVYQQLQGTSKRARVHLEVETGMNRTGARCQTSIEIYRFIQKHPCFELIGIYSHLANSDYDQDPLNTKQHQLFHQWIQQCNGSYLFHLANSGALLHFPDTHYNMVRAGLLSYGIYPHQNALEKVQVQPAFTVKSRVSYFKVVDAHQGIGYGSSYQTPRQTRIATLSIGYGDGYRRCLSGKAWVLIRGQKYPVVGQICMDQLMVDLGEGEAYVGDEVVLLGKQGSEEITVYELAQWANTIPYEILTGFNERVARFYI